MIDVVLGSPTRIKIVIVLYKYGEMSLTELAKRVGASTGAVLAQVKVLTEHGVVVVKQLGGRIRLYKLSDAPEIRRLAEALAKADQLLAA